MTDRSAIQQPARWNPLHVVLSILIFLTISRFHQRFPALQPLRPAAVLVALALFFALFNHRLIAMENWLGTRPGRIVLALGALACISAPFGISFGASARFILDSYSKVLLLAILVMIAIRRVTDLRRLVWAFVLGVGFLVYVAFFVFEVSLTPDGSLMRLSDMDTWDANDLGCVLLTGMPLVLLVVRTSRGGARYLTMGILAGATMAIARTGSRGAMVGLAGLAFALLLSVRTLSMGRRVGILVLAVLALVVAAPPGYWTQMATLTNPTEDYNWTAAYGRKEVAKRGVGYMLSRPVFGLGANNFGRAEGTLSEVAQNYSPGTRPPPWVAPHNSYIEVGAELGIPGLVLWLGLVFGGMHSMWRLSRRIPPEWQFGDSGERFLFHAPFHLILAMVGFAVTSAFVTFAYLDPVYLLAAMMAGTLGIVHTRVRPQRDAARRPRRGVIPV